jgi:hypothetical protein
VASDFALEHNKQPLTGTDIDAWEHIPPRYNEWKAAGILPAITGTTDTHSGTFDVTERTIVLAPGPTGRDVADAIRKKQVVALSFFRARFLYGPDEMTSLVWSALAEGSALKAAKAERIKAALKKADLAELLRISPSRPEVPPAPVGK